MTNILGGYEWARWEQYWLMIAFVGFFIVHVVQVAITGWSNFRSMITSYEAVVAETKISVSSLNETEGEATAV